MTITPQTTDATPATRTKPPNRCSLRSAVSASHEGNANDEAPVLRRRWRFTSDPLVAGGLTPRVLIPGKEYQVNNVIRDNSREAQLAIMSVSRERVGPVDRRVYP